jgi:hypothetical protein
VRECCSEKSGADNEIIEIGHVMFCLKIFFDIVFSGMFWERVKFP